MENLCDDLLSIISIYSNYHDFYNLYETNLLWNNFLKKTSYFKFLKLIKNCNIKFQETKKLFYYFCNIGEIEIARNIYLIGNFRIFIARDIHLNECPIDLETIKRAVKIKGFQDDFIFLHENTFDNYMILLKSLKIYEYDNYEDYFFMLCNIKKNCSAVLARFQMIYVLGDTEESTLDLKFINCCSNGKNDFIDFLLRYNKFNTSTIEKGIIMCIISEQKETLLKLIGRLNNKIEIIENVIRLCCKYNKMNFIRNIQKHFDNSTFQFIESLISKFVV